MSQILDIVVVLTDMDILVLNKVYYYYYYMDVTDLGHCCGVDRQGSHRSWILLRC